METALKRVDESQPKACFKKLAIIRKYSLKKRALEHGIEKFTSLDKKGEGS